MEIDKTKYTVVLSDEDSGEPYKILSVFDTYQQACKFMADNYTNDIDLLHNGRFISFTLGAF